MENLERFRKCETYEEFALYQLGDLCCDLMHEMDRLRREVDVLRIYGNKDCTAMADEHLASVSDTQKTGEA